MRRVVVAICLVGVVLCGRLSAEDSGVRTWTSNRGQAIEASFVKMQSGMVHLARADGDVVNIPLSRLSVADQKVATEMAAESFTSARKVDATTGASPMKPGAVRVLTDEEIATLKSDWSDGERKTSISATFTTDTVRAAKEAARFRKSGEVPVRITAALYEARPTGGRMVSRRLRGTCRMYVLDEEGEVVFKTSQNLDKMCPT